MKYQVDQSGRIEETNKNTVITCANKNFSQTVLIPAKVKRQLLEVFRRKGKPKLFMYRTFAAGVFFSAKKFLKKETILEIDSEYPGHEILIQDIIWEFCEKNQLPRPRVWYKNIGREAIAHKKAYYAYKKKRGFDKVLTFEELRVLVLKLKKTESP